MMQHSVNYFGRLVDGDLPFGAMTGVTLINGGEAATMNTEERELSPGDRIADYDLFAAPGTASIRLYDVLDDGSLEELNTDDSGRLLWPGDQVVSTCPPSDILVQAGLVVTITDTLMGATSGTGIFLIMFPLLTADMSSQIADLADRVTALEGV